MTRKNHSVQFSSVAQSCPTLCDPMDCSTPDLPSITNSWSLLRLMSIKLVMPSNYLILCCPLLLLPSIFPNESALCVWWPKYWNFSISPCNEYSGLISLRIDWFALHGVPGTHKSPLPPQFKSVSSLPQVAKVLELQLQHQTFQRIFRTGLL